MFLLYINDIGSDCSSTIRLFADDIILYSIAESTSDAKHLQSDLSTMEFVVRYGSLINDNACSV